MRRKKNTGKKIFLTLFVVALGVATAVVYVYYRPEDNGEQKTSENVYSIKQEEQLGGIEIKEDELDPAKKEVVKYEGEDPNEKEYLTGSISYLNVKNNKLIIRANIDQFISGTCELEISGATVYNEETYIIQDVSTSECDGFDIPIEKFNSGQHEIKIKINSGEKTGEIVGEINI